MSEREDKNVTQFEFADNGTVESTEQSCKKLINNKKVKNKQKIYSKKLNEVLNIFSYNF